eukprot:83910-Chlamydomonas_euryale.AAC.3
MMLILLRLRQLQGSSDRHASSCTMRRFHGRWRADGLLRFEERTCGGRGLTAAIPLGSHLRTPAACRRLRTSPRATSDALRHAAAVLSARLPHASTPRGPPHRPATSTVSLIRRRRCSGAHLRSCGAVPPQPPPSCWCLSARPLPAAATSSSAPAGGGGRVALPPRQAPWATRAGGRRAAATARC